ncbi:MAG TPA: phosphate:AMP phosphotransferase [Erysipelothrix sp.]|jgi:polyphosphate:AMP phosphotransferase|nr:phosphate:AMP phosphotransferase [Erysipelothrix sp.]
MLKNYIKELKELAVEDVKRSDLGAELGKYQRELMDKGQSLVIFIDGFESSGRSEVIKDLIREMDPRYFKVDSSSMPSSSDKKYPFLWRFMKKMPKNGNVVVFDRSIYFEVFHNLKLKGKELKKAIEDLLFFEELLISDNTILCKFFLVQSEKKMEERVEKLHSDKFRHFFVDDKDLEQLKNYDKYIDHFDKVLQLTSTKLSPWQIVLTDNIKEASRYVLMSTLNMVKIHFEKEQIEPVIDLKPLKNNPVSEIDLTKEISDEEYDKQIDNLQAEASELLYTLYQKQLSGVIIFEGTDAAGKGGAIKRLTRQMDPRMYQVSTTAAPTKEEISHHYLWRFYRELPPKGHLTIFDRSWYGRVMVERLEEFTALVRTQQAYKEIRDFEKSLVRSDMFVLKFLIVIDKQEQRLRFESRQNNPDKAYKLTDEDWRNHDKFYEYEDVMNEMVVRTHKNRAPWILVSGQNKKYARIQVLKVFIKHVSEFLEKYD